MKWNHKKRVLKTNPPCDGGIARNRKSGVAVIVTLGLLALLMVLGVSFTISMRAERAGVSNYIGEVEDRNMTWAGLARAIEAINTSITNMYPDGDFLVSGVDRWGTSSTNDETVLVLSGNARKYLPTSLQANNSKRAGWVELDGETRKVAYIVINLSDMLDINEVGDVVGTTREGGLDPSEISLEFLGIDPADIDDVIDYRNYTTLADFSRIFPNVDNDYFVTKSRFVADDPITINNTTIQPVDLSGTVSEIEGREVPVDAGPILRNLSLMWFDAEGGMPNLATMRKLPPMLFDYLDMSAKGPRDLEGPNMRPVPMLNEVSLIGESFDLDELRSVLVFKTWFPYEGITPRSPIVSISGTYSFELVVAGGAVDSGGGNIAAIDAPDDASKDTVYPTHDRWALVINEDIAPAIATNAAERPFSFTVGLDDVQLVGASGVIDSTEDMEFDFTVSGTISAEGAASKFNVTGVANRTWEVEDPRLNWDQKYWISSTNMPIGHADGYLNRSTRALWDTRADLETKYPLFASSADFLYSPLELGHLLWPDLDAASINANLAPGDFAPWSTIRVFNSFDGSGNIVEDRHRILELFTVNTNEVRKGLVNLNTEYEGVLETAFHSIPFPGPVVDRTDAPDVVTRKLAKILVDYRKANGSYESVPKILDLDWKSELASANLTDVELNALAAYSTGLLGVRQNLFLVVVRASSGVNKLLAIVWRDPVENAAGLHDTVVLHIEWLR